MGFCWFGRGGSDRLWYGVASPLPERFVRSVEASTAKATWELMPLKKGSEAAMLTNFTQCVRGEKENPYSPDYELEVYKLLLRCCGA